MTHVRRADGERGASSIELVLYTPLLMLVTLLIVQTALTWYGDELAGAVARETARVVRTGGGTPQAEALARERAQEFARNVGRGQLSDLDVEISRPDDRTVRVTVSGRGQEILTGMAPRVSATVEGPVEGFRADM